MPSTSNWVLSDPGAGRPGAQREAGTSAEMLVRALRIGRQSLYDPFGDKWQIYLSSVRRYVGAETRAHVLSGKPMGALKRDRHSRV